MTLTGRLLRGTRSNLMNPPEKLWSAWGGPSSYSGENVTVQAALEVGAFFACIRLLTMTLGQIPLTVYQGEGRDRSKARDSIQWRICHDEPNAEQAADVFWQVALGDLIVGDGRYGDFFAEKSRVSSGPRSGRVEELHRLEPSKMTVEREKASPYTKRYSLDGDPASYTDADILHIPGYSTGGLRGMSFVWLARQDIGTAIGREKYEGSFYANGATFPGFLSTSGTLSPEAAARIATAWQSAHGGNKHKTPVLEAGLDFKPVAPPMRDQQFAELSRITASKVARWFGIDPEMIGGDRSSDTYATVEGRALHFLTFALDPWLVRIEKGLRRDPDLFGQNNLFPEFLRSALLRVDAKSRAENYKLYHDIGAYSPNDILFKENEPPRPGGDVYLDTPPGTAPANGTGSKTAVPAP